MSIQSEYTRLVSKYLEGGMSGSEKYIFEDQLTGDPLLKAEFDHQNEIVTGLQEYRKAQLKTRLNGVSVGPGILGVISQSATMKTLSYVITSILVGTGSYFYFTSTENVEQVNLLPLESKLDFLNSKYKPSDFILELNYKYTKPNSPAKWVDSGQAEVLEREGQVNTIEFNVPEVSDDIPDDLTPQPDQILEKAIARNTSFADATKIDKVDIENVVTNRYKFHYRLDNNKLYLYGKFEASPYEIIEINSFQSKKLFFYYNGNYFRLNQDVNEISPLIKIQNSEVIKELSILKTKG